MENNIFKNIVKSELSYFARLTVARFKPYIVGVTGSSGKTSQRYIISEMVKASGKRYFSPFGNLNTEIGLPLAILGYNESPKNWLDWVRVGLGVPLSYLLRFSYPEILILEYGCDKPGDMKELLRVATPDLTVITNFGIAHIEQFKTLESIITEKWALAKATHDSVVCSKTVASEGNKIAPIKAQILTPGDSIVASNIEMFSNRTDFNLTKDGKSYHVSSKMLGRHNVDNIVLAAITASSLGVDIEKILLVIGHLKPLAGRGERLQSIRGIMIIDESYNANPLSMEAALKNFESTSLGRKVAVLGEMKEIGHLSEVSHFEIAAYAKKICDYTIGVGDGFKSQELDKWYQNVEQLIKDADKLFRKGDVVLVKGSLANKLNKLVEYLK